MSNTPVELLLTKLPDARPNGNGWASKCPAHDDERPSLSVSTGDDGRALVHCHAGCDIDAICDALGLRVADLMPTDPSAESTSTVTHFAGRKRQHRGHDNGKAIGNSYQKAEGAVAELERTHGKPSAQWTYTNAEGTPVGMIVRWDKPDGTKQIRPVARYPEGWRIQGMPVPRPLYGLPNLVDADRVFIVEGEKAADAARSVGLVATTSPHGSKSADKTDWSVLASKDCVILPDNDDAGRAYANDVAAILATLTPAPTVRIFELWELPDDSPMPKGGDVADWIDAHGDAAEPAAMADELKSLAEAANVVEVEPPRAERFRPFPTDALPEPIRSFVVAGANAIGCDTSFVALPLLSILASAIGNSRVIQLTSDWSEPAIIWTAIVGESGTSKTPAVKLVMRPVREHQRKALQLHAEAMQNHEVDLARHEKDYAAWKRDKSDSDPPVKPTEPIGARYVVSDTTVEALSPLLLANPRGLLLVRDELAGWLGSFDRYAGGKGGVDAAHWLSMHSADSIIVDRKTAKPRTIVVPLASVSITGGIQPAILHRALGNEHREDGLAARLLMAWPPRKAKRWRDAVIAPEAKSAIARLLDWLYDLELSVDDDGHPHPGIVTLTPDARDAFREFANRHGVEQVELTGDLAAVWSKLEAYAARLALIVHLVRWAIGDASICDPNLIDVESIDFAVTLVDWFGQEARRIYAMLDESDDQRDQRRLVELIERKGGLVKARDLMRSSRKWATTPDAEAALGDLVKADLGRWVEQPTSSKGGRPTRVFVLRDVADVDTTPAKPGENGSCVNVNNVHFSSKTVEWETPQDLFDQLNEEFEFDMDVCATPENAKCSHFFTPAVDGLKQPWTGSCWMNPPYGREIPKWMEKAYESCQQGATVVCLVPARTDTRWWHDYAVQGEIRYLKGRLRFGDADTSAPFPSAIVVLRPPTSDEDWGEL